ncbi:MAG: acetyl-CoA carboxylase biotin carboxyl carrier protein subunit [Aquaticitalea sp.]
MIQSYKVNVDNTFDFDIAEADISNFDSIETSNSKFHILQDNQSFTAAIIEADFSLRTYKVIVNNNTYNILISNPLDAMIKELGFEIGLHKKVNEIKAPMPGLILDITVKVGQEVKENDPLLILEAMKMENVILSPRAGLIKSIAVEKGNAVDKNQLLIEFE